MAFVSRQNQRTSVERQKEYIAWCKEVRKAVSNDKEKWWNGVMAMLEEDLRWNGQGDIFKKLKRLNGSKTKPVDLVLIHTFQ